MTQHVDKAAIFDTLANQAAQGDLVFSTGAQLALKLRSALDDPDCHVNTAARLIQAEPLLSARVIAIANSVVYNRSGREIADVHIAVSLLGFKTIRSLAMALVTRQMAGKSKNPAASELVNKLWEHSAHVASLAHAIARHVTHQDPETALFAGIIHEIGGFYMLSRAEEFPDLLEGDFDEWVEGGEIKVGRAVHRQAQGAGFGDRGHRNFLGRISCHAADDAGGHAAAGRGAFPGAITFAQWTARIRTTA